MPDRSFQAEAASRAGLIQVLDPSGETAAMGTAFWVRRFMLVFVVAACIIASAQRLRGHDLAYSLTQGVLWAAISASVFTASRIHQSGKGVHCAICRDTPAMQTSSLRDQV